MEQSEIIFLYSEIMFLCKMLRLSILTASVFIHFHYIERSGQCFIFFKNSLLCSLVYKDMTAILIFEQINFFNCFLDFSSNIYVS